MNTAAEVSLRDKSSETTGKGFKRAREIIATARAILAREGNAGLSMRAVATQMGVSLSNVQHYYPSRDVLLEAVFSQMLLDYQAGVDRIASADAQGPRLRQFEDVIDYVLEEISKPEPSAVMRELWALASRNAFAADIADSFLTRSRKVFRNQIQAVAPELSKAECELRGAMVVAQLQGLTLFLCSSTPPHAALKTLRLAARKSLVQLAIGFAADVTGKSGRRHNPNERTP
jgi:AcrR family transcriptional regulator